MILLCGTSNPGKLREFRLAASGFGGRFEVRPVDAPPPEEHGSTFEETAIDKALHYSRHTHNHHTHNHAGFVFADDSGLEVDSLGGAPGVFSARFAGVNATDAENNALLLEKLHGVMNRAARFVCAIALANHGELIQTFRGVVEGRIVEEPRGSHGFGYDPLFYYERFGCTFGEASDAQKMSVSHRARALNAMFVFLSQPDGGSSR